MRYIFFALFLGIWAKAQTTNDESIIIDNGDRDSIKIFKPTINDYLYYTQFSEKKVFDTVFTIDKSYRFTQYNNQDNFGRVQFSNIGSGFQQLKYTQNSEEDLTLLPQKKSFFILGIKDIKYYNVKTPTTAFHYHNGVNNGGVLQTTYTQNIGKRFNFAIEYMGLRSKGFYQRELSASNNLTFSGHYISKNQKYELFSHYISQNISNEENGGISNLENFISGDSRFNSRENLVINLKNSHSKFSIRRYYLSHSFSPFNKEKIPFNLKHTFYYQSNRYGYQQDGDETYYTSPILQNYPANAQKFSKNLSNTFSLGFNQDKFKAEAGIRHQIIRYETRSPIIINQQVIDSQLKENRFGIVGNLSISLWDKVNAKSSLEISRGQEFGNYINSTNQLTFEPIKDYFLNTWLNFKSSAPTFSYIMNASFYKDYNYKFNFKNQNIIEFGADLGLKWFSSKISANYFRIHQMTYFDGTGKPQQTNSAINISQIGGEATFNYKKFHLNTQILFQNVLNNKNLLPLPQWIGRANLYYQSKVFRNSAEIQTGIKTYYFSKFASKEYFPLLNEFILPSKGYSIGGQPIADAYVNFKVKRMMIYAEAQHFNTIFSKNQSYTAPYYPIVDFRLNLGIVWYLFH